MNKYSKAYKAFETTTSAAIAATSFTVEIYSFHHNICIYVYNGMLCCHVVCAREPNILECCLGISMERKLKRAIRRLQKLCERYNVIIGEVAVLSEGLERWHKTKGAKPPIK